jgi:hypothetical protein
MAARVLIHTPAEHAAWLGNPAPMQLASAR